MSVTSDLLTLLGNHTFANNSALSGEPSIHEMQDDLTTFPTYGEIILHGERRVKRQEIYNRLTQTWIVECEIRYNNTDTEPNDVVDALIDEIDDTFKTNNASVSRDYFITMLYTKNRNRSTSYANAVISVIKEWQII